MNERTLPAIDQGLATAGRSRSDLELTAEVIVGCGRTDQELDRARAVRFLIAFYGSTPAYAPVLEVEGWTDLQPELNRLSKRGEWDTMTSLVTDEMVSTIAVFGTPAQCATQIVDRFGDQVSRICAYFPGYEPSDELLAEFVAAVKAAS
jgi:alkanesulfonate monooxygenase SsuD/methylene tetrahydromethanopterin reductase-like flavin-dependent oxidoreductase (luciferase family)